MNYSRYSINTLNININYLLGIKWLREIINHLTKMHCLKIISMTQIGKSIKKNDHL